MNLRKGYFLSLGGNGGRDQWSSVDQRGPDICQGTDLYKKTPYIDRVLLYELIDEIAKMGIDLVVVDVLDAMQYDSHPEISLQNAFTHAEIRKLLSYMRERGIEPVPKLNFSSCHDTWLKEYSWMKGTAKYYEVVKDLIDEHFVGILATPWAGIQQINRYRLLDDAYRLMHACKLLETEKTEA